ncbi:MAG: RidA family protein [Fastidiosipilaceae bacterium]|jgi:2-iminobutanoate/2-iminopropanoate deaminase|nr:RidA family protein [Clostridiaceae bacterium]
MNHKIIHTDQAPQALGPYVQARQVGSHIYLSGQLGIDMMTGELPSAAVDQMMHALLNMEAILKAAGAQKEDVVKTTVFLTDIDHFSGINEVYAAFFGEHKPARSCVEVSALPKGALVECECIAIVEDS